MAPHEHIAEDRIALHVCTATPPIVTLRGDHALDARPVEAAAIDLAREHGDVGPSAQAGYEASARAVSLDAGR